MEPSRIFVVGRVRSGTTVFRHLLMSHPDVYAYSEILNEGVKVNFFRYLEARCRTNPEFCFASNRVQCFNDFLDSLCLSHSTRYVSFDTKYESLHLVYKPWKRATDVPVLFPLIKQNSWKIIHITRRNHLRRLVSDLYAMRLGRYKSKITDNVTATFLPVTVKTDNLLDQFASIERSYQGTSTLFDGYPHFIEFDYDELFVDTGDGGSVFPQKITSSLSDFLDLTDRFDRKPFLRRMMTWDLNRIISNYTEVCEVLRGSPFEWCLDTSVNCVEQNVN